MSEQELSPELEAALKDFRKKIADYQSAHSADSADLAALDPSSLTVTDMELWQKAIQLIGQADNIVASPEESSRVFGEALKFTRDMREAVANGATQSFVYFLRNMIFPLYSYSSDYDFLMSGLNEYKDYLQDRKDKMGIK